MKKTLLTLVLLAAMLLASCSQASDGGNTDTSATSGETTTAETMPIEIVDLGGETISILLNEGFDQLSAETETGDIINDAVYQRNSLVEEKFNVEFKFDSRPGYAGDYVNWLGVINACIASGDNTYQLVGGYGYRYTADTLGGSYYNLNDNKYIDFSQPWWPSKVMDAANIGDNLYVAVGNIDPGYYDTMMVLYFNKVLADSLGVNNFYKDVNNGVWTLDKLIEVAKSTTVDADGNGTFDEKDQYGYVSDKSILLDPFFTSCGVQITDKDSDGLPVLLGLTDRYVEVQNRVNDFINNSSVVYTGSESKGNIFRGSRALILPQAIRTSHTLRDMEDDFGIIPYPKLNEEQSNYRTHCLITDCNGYAIPITADADMVGCVLEALAYYGYNDILPEYFERALKTKSARDDESAEMLDLIYNSIEIDFTQFYSFCFGDQKSPSMLLRMVTRNNSTDIASAWAKDQELYDLTMEMIIDTLK